VGGEHQDIFAALAQWRKIDGDDGEAIIEVLPESGGLDLVFEVPMGGSNDVDIDP
jgi:hypothetical protein